MVNISQCLILIFDSVMCGAQNMIIAHEVGDSLGYLGRNWSGGLGWVGWGRGLGGGWGEDPGFSIIIIITVTQEILYLVLLVLLPITLYYYYIIAIENIKKWNIKNFVCNLLKKNSKNILQLFNEQKVIGKYKYSYMWSH